MPEPYQFSAEDIDAQKKIIAVKLNNIRNRQSFSYSHALHQHYIELVKKDMKLSCLLTDLLTRKA